MSPSCAASGPLAASRPLGGQGSPTPAPSGTSGNQAGGQVGHSQMQALHQEAQPSPEGLRSPSKPGSIGA